MAEMKNRYGDGRLRNLLTEQLLDSVCRVYHYKPCDMTLLGRVAADLSVCMRGQEAFYCRYPVIPEQKESQETAPLSATVLLTLGGGVDLLLERYHQTERILEQCMLESICNELLMEGNRLVNRWIWEWTGWYAVSMHFYGSEEHLLLEELPEVLAQLGQKKVSCTGDYCLRPEKSVIYQVGLSGVQSGRCANLCDTCGRRATCLQSQ